MSEEDRPLKPWEVKAVLKVLGNEAPQEVLDEITEFLAEDRKKKPYVKPDELPELPPSTDKFWTEAEKHTIPKPQSVQVSMGDHKVKIMGDYAVCQSCPYTHTIPYNPSKFTVVDGQFVRK